RIFFRGIYFSQMGWREWGRVILENRKSIFKLAKAGINEWRKTDKKKIGFAGLPDMAKNKQ
ncbi:MAG: hypothetical protein AB1489_38785, partial [Acidobacteriota bacterium]